MLDAIGTLRVDDGDEPDNAAVAAFPVPREQREGAAPAGDLVDVAADILDAENAVLEQNAVDRLPVREVILPVAPAGPLPVFLGEMGMQRAVALRADGGGERMVVRLGIMADDLDLLLDEPLAGRGHETRRAAEIVLVVLVSLMPAGIDDDYIARTHHRARGLFQIVVGDGLPLLLGDGDHDPGAEEMRQRDFIDERRALHHVRRCIDMGRIVHAGGDALRQPSRFGVVMDTLDLHVLEIGPVRGLVTEAVGQIVELKPHAVVVILLKRDATNFFCHSIPPYNSQPGSSEAKPGDFPRMSLRSMRPTVSAFPQTRRPKSLCHCIPSHLRPPTSGNLAYPHTHLIRLNEHTVQKTGARNNSGGAPWSARSRSRSTAFVLGSRTTGRPPWSIFRQSEGRNSTRASPISASCGLQRWMRPASRAASSRSPGRGCRPRPMRGPLSAEPGRRMTFWRPRSQNAPIAIAGLPTSQCRTPRPPPTS